VGDKKEYIERGALIEIFNCKSDMALGTPKAVFANAAKMVELMPAADVVEVRHGEWKKRGNEKKCSVCDFIYYSNNDEWTYCPNCGAKMGGGRNDKP
jgi:rubrerythrin